MSEGYGSHEVAQPLDITISSADGVDLVLLSSVFRSTFGRELIVFVSKSVSTKAASCPPRQHLAA